MIDAIKIAAHAKSAIAAKVAVAIEHREPRELDRQAFAAVIHRPQDRDAAPGLPGRDRARDLAVGIEFQLGGDLAPQSAEGGGGTRTDELHEFIGAEHEAALAIHLPDEAQGMPSLRCGLVATARRRRCS